ncbi:hypothetical protein LguiA_031059 [Lonicera macranthoides]
MASGCKDNTSSCNDVKKNSWPELCGLPGGYVAGYIEMTNPNVHALIYLEGTPVDGETHCDRVRVWVNKSGTVVEVPVVG